MGFDCSGHPDERVKSWGRPFLSCSPFSSCPVVHGAASRGNFVVSWCAGAPKLSLRQRPRWAPAQPSAQRAALPLSPTAGSVGRRGSGRRSGQGGGSGLPLYAQHAICLLTTLCRLLRAVRRQEHLLQLRPRDPGPVSAQGKTGVGRCLCVDGVWGAAQTTAGKQRRPRATKF